jgi:hypothetical protein
MEQSMVSQVRDQLKVMTLEEKSELADQLGISEDFQLA